MKLYDRNVNWSVFDGEITLSAAAKKHLLATVFQNRSKNVDIILEIQNQRYKARLMNVESSSSVQISYGKNVQKCFKNIFEYSFKYYEDLYANGKRRKPFQTMEWITVSETQDDFVYRVDCKNCDFVRLLNSDEDERLTSEVNIALDDNTIGSTFRGDIPKAKTQPVTIRGRKVYPRNRQTAINALINANFACEFDCTHSSFLRKSTGKRYMEPHHLIPLSYSDDDKFDNVSLDVEANIVSLCSNCHNQIHYGQDYENLLKKLYNERKARLLASGINISEDELLEMYI